MATPEGSNNSTETEQYLLAAVPNARVPDGWQMAPEAWAHRAGPSLGLALPSWKMQRLTWVGRAYM